MEPDELRKRARISARLKAVRWLLAQPRPTTKNQLGYKTEPISAKDLADWDGLRDNGITASMLGRSERMERKTMPMELYTIAEALGLPRDYFTREDALSVVTQPPEGGRPPGPPDELFPARSGDQPKPDTGPDGRSHRGKSSQPGIG